MEPTEDVIVTATCLEIAGRELDAARERLVVAEQILSDALDMAERARVEVHAACDLVEQCGRAFVQARA